MLVGIFFYLGPCKALGHILLNPRSSHALRIRAANVPGGSNNAQTKIEQGLGTPANNSSLLDDESLLQHRVSSSPAKELKFACSWSLMTISGLILNLSTCSLLLGSLPHLNGGVEGIKTAKQCGKLRLFSRLAWQQSRHHDKRPLRKHFSDELRRDYESWRLH